MALRGLAIVVAGATTACSPFGGGAFACQDDVQCEGGGPEGRCEPNGRCSFADGTCASGRRYGALSGDNANVCVGDEPPVDAPEGDGPGDAPSGDAPVDTPMAAPFCDAAGEPTLVGCWEFEGVATDASGDGNDATLQNTTFAAGRVGMGLAMTAQSSVAVADSASLTPTTLTIEAWLNPTALPTGGGRMGVMDNDGQYGLFLNSTGILCSMTNGYSAAFAFPLNAWTHVACSYDGTTVRLYINGAPVAMGAGNGDLGAGNNNGSQLGGNSPTGDRFLGTMDQVRVWNVARTESQICAAAMAPLCP